jgi:hypothetical protein
MWAKTGDYNEHIDVEAPRIPRNKRQAVGGRRLTGAGLGVHYTRTETPV